MEIESKVIRVIEKTLGVKPGEISGESGIGDVPKWDSLGHLKIISSLEKEFQIEFDPDTIIDIEDVNGFIATIKELLEHGTAEN